MKTTKRKRSAKAAPARKRSVVGAVGAETSASSAAEGLAAVAVDTAVSEAVADLTAELSPAAVAALVAEPVVEPLLEAATQTGAATAEPVAEAIAEAAIESVAEPVAATVDAAAEPAADGIVETAAAIVAAETDPKRDPKRDPETDLVDQTAETIVADALELTAVAPAAAGEPVVALAANCSVKDAAALKISLCAIANESTDVTLDVSAVERVDTATMQLLCAFARDRIGRNQSITWRGESQALQDAVRLLGVGALLGFESFESFDSKGVAA